MNGPLRRHATLVMLALPLAMSVSLPLGCDVETTPDTLSVSDASQQGCNAPEDGGLSRPVAVGARVDLLLKRGDHEVEVIDAFSSDTSVFDVLAVGNPSPVRALAEGDADITLADDEGEITVTLSAAPIAQTRVDVDGLTIVNLDSELEEPHPTGTEPLAAQGYALLPDGELTLRVTYLDDGGTSLLGYDLAEWTADPPGAFLFDLQIDDRTDHVRVRPTCLVKGSVTLSTGTGGTFEVTVLDAGDAVDLEAYWPELGETAEEIDLSPGEIATAVGVLRDGSGRVVLGSDGAPYDAEVVDGADVVAIVPAPWGDEAPTQDDLQLLQDHRVAYIEALGAGEATVRLTTAGLERLITVSVAE